MDKGFILSHFKTQIQPIIFMKRNILLLLFLSVCISSFAQTTQGTVAVGGGVSISTTNQEDPDDDFKTTRFTFTPTAGYFLADGMELGLMLNLSTLKYEQGSADQKQTNVGIGPYFKYYIFTANENFAFTLNASAVFGSTKVSPVVGDDVKGTSFNLAISPGFTYFFTEKWGLDFQLQGISYYTRDPNTDGDAEDDRESGFTFGASSFSPSLGFRYFIGR